MSILGFVLMIFGMFVFMAFVVMIMDTWIFKYFIALMAIAGFVLFLLMVI